MKKVFLAAMICLMFVGTTQAQYKPEGMALTTELQFTPVQVTNGQVFDNNMAFRGRLFIADNMAIRLTLGYASMTDKSVDYDPANIGNEDDYMTTKDKESQFVFAPGFEYHFKGAERLSPYVGAEVGLVLGSAKETIDNSFNDDKSLTKQKGFGFDVSAVAGVDFYVYKGLYMGAEIGLGYASMKYGYGTNEITINGTTVTTDLKDYTQESKLGFHCSPAIRLGWKF
ncbi:MAG: BT1926 family outer membrane beta-barrel protein [Bacteroidales bacterium]|nr:BT1926 family outer membrane beta-barrel protein [Bacteroidales bacterium]